MPEIRGFIANSLNEWKGLISAVLFLSGCNWRCPYCHGWRFISAPDSLPLFSFEEVARSLRKNHGWVEGVVITGGEATLHPGLPLLMETLKKMHLAIKIHSNGSRPSVLRTCLERGWVDCLALDFKAPLNDVALTRANGGIPSQVDLVRESIKLGIEYNVDLELHTTLCPGVITLNQVREMAVELSILAPDVRWMLQQYHPREVLDATSAGEGVYSPAELKSLTDEVKNIIHGVEVRGV